LDLHAASFSLAVLSPQGRMAQSLSRPTSERSLIEVIEAIPGPKQLVVEESHLAEWAKRVITPYVDQLVICDPQRNAWIAKDDFNNDLSSAEKLAKLLHGGFIKEIRHPGEEGAELRGLFLHYHDLTVQATRFKNKLKAVFRSEAIATRGKGIYEEENHREWLGQLKALPHRRQEAEHWFELIDQLEGLKEEAFKRMTKRARERKAYALLEGIPGIGAVVATGYLAMLETPHRFSRKNKLWKYASLGQVKRVSDHVPYADYASRQGNRVLKWLVFTHFQGAVERAVKTNRFKRKFEELRARGLSFGAARRHICRALLSSVRAIWKKEEPYRDHPVSQNPRG
jgi:transposase